MGGEAGGGGGGGSKPQANTDLLSSEGLSSKS